MTIKLVTAATSDPLSVTEAKAHCRVDFDTDDAYITSLITAATDWVQHRTGRQFVKARFRQSWDSYPQVRVPSRWNALAQSNGAHIWYPGMETAHVELAVMPVLSVVEVDYYDVNDVQQTVSSAQYWTDTDNSPPRIVPKNNWPNIYLGRPNAFQVIYDAGYGVDGTYVPQLLKQAILWLVAHWYENREAVTINQYAREVPLAVESACMRYEVGVIP